MWREEWRMLYKNWKGSNLSGVSGRTKDRGKFDTISLLALIGILLTLTLIGMLLVLIVLAVGILFNLDGMTILGICFLALFFCWIVAMVVWYIVCGNE